MSKNKKTAKGAKSAKSRNMKGAKNATKSAVTKSAKNKEKGKEQEEKQELKERKLADSFAVLDKRDKILLNPPKKGTDSYHVHVIMSNCALTAIKKGLTAITFTEILELIAKRVNRTVAEVAQHFTKPSGFSAGRLVNRAFSLTCAESGTMTDKKSGKKNSYAKSAGYFRRSEGQVGYNVRNATSSGCYFLTVAVREDNSRLEYPEATVDIAVKELWDKGA